jgi:AcrR family transcriptional regulator
MATRRAPLTRERILEKALELADEHGLESLSMRRLGGDLGVEAMSLYNHVSNKRDLLTGLVERVAAEMAPPAFGDDWRADVRAHAVSSSRALRAHPWAINLMLSPQYVTDSRLQTMDRLLARLREAGFGEADVYHAYHAIEGHIFGFSLWLAGHNITSDDLPALARSFVEEYDLERFSEIVTHVRMHVEEGPHHDVSAFEFALDLLLDGLERLRAGA